MRKITTRSIGFLLVLSLLPLASTAGHAAPAGQAPCEAMTKNTYRSVNPGSGATLLSTSTAEIAAARQSFGFTEDKGLAFRAASAAGDGLHPVYRMYRDGNFVWMPDTPGVGEFENAQNSHGYQTQHLEFYASTTPLDCAVPVHRYLKGDTHRFATTSVERAELAQDGWSDEGPKFWVAAPQGTTPPAPVPAPPAPVPPTPVPAPVPAPASNWVNWGSVASPGENINTVLAKPELAGKVLKLPAGVFEVSNFRDPAAAIRVPSTVKGIVGEGRDTIIRMKTNTSSFAATVPTQGSGQTNQLYLLRMNDGQDQVLSNFWLQGTEQGHLYNGIMVGQSSPGTTVKDILITGVPGDAGTPPGETFGLNWWRGSDSVTRNVEIDGYRWTGNTFGSRVKGAIVGASPIGYNNHDRARLYDVFTHDSKVGMPTFWQSNDAQTWNLQSIRNVTGINHEESFNIVHHQPVMHSSYTRRHVNFMSNTSDGKLTIIGAVTDGWISGSESGPIGKGKRMLMLTPNSYRSSNDNTIKTAPTVVRDDGVSPVPYTWAH
ncbi:hypothetical protein ACX80O_14630 [Arthrobacter sp. Hz1]